MNISFKLVWFENEEPSYEAHLDNIESIIKEFHLVPDIKHYRCDEFDIAIVEDADLILADFDLGIDNSVNIINNSFRENDIVIDALLYSSKYQNMVEEIRKVNPLMEGVFCAKRGHEDLYDKLRKLIFRIVKRAETVENLRGLVMEYSSVFDKTIYELINAFCQEENIAKKVYLYINDKLGASKKERIYKSCSKNGKNCSTECGEFKSACDTKKGCCYLPAEISGMDPIAKEDLYNKSRILDFILSYLIKENLIDSKYKDFHKNFYNKIIVYRNALAHQNSNENSLYIRDFEQYVDINQDLFYTIKDNIIDYISTFFSINEYIKQKAEESNNTDNSKELVAVM